MRSINALSDQMPQTIQMLAGDFIKERTLVQIVPFPNYERNGKLHGFFIAHVDIDDGHAAPCLLYKQFLDWYSKYSVDILGVTFFILQSRLDKPYYKVLFNRDKGSKEIKDHALREIKFQEPTNPEHPYYCHGVRPIGLIRFRRITKIISKEISFADKKDEKRQEGNDPEIEEEQLHVIRLKRKKMPPLDSLKICTAEEMLKSIRCNGI